MGGPPSGSYLLGALDGAREPGGGWLGGGGGLKSLGPGGRIIGGGGGPGGPGRPGVGGPSYLPLSLREERRSRLSSMTVSSCTR